MKYVVEIPEVPVRLTKRRAEGISKKSTKKAPSKKSTAKVSSPKKNSGEAPKSRAK
jgi:hypothetical protein